MKVADGYTVHCHMEKVRIRLSLMRGSTEISCILFDEDEIEKLAAILRGAIESAKAEPKRKTAHLWTAHLEPVKPLGGN
jgi:hypothetical protein